MAKFKRGVYALRTVNLLLWILCEVVELWSGQSIFFPMRIFIRNEKTHAAFPRVEVILRRFLRMNWDPQCLEKGCLESDKFKQRNFNEENFHNLFLRYSMAVPPHRNFANYCSSCVTKKIKSKIVVTNLMYLFKILRPWIGGEEKNEHFSTPIFLILCNDLICFEKSGVQK